MNFTPHGINKGKVVYWVNGKSFENTGDKRDGKEKATNYCLENFINPNDIKKFDSRTERDRFEYLLELEKQGKISHLQHHFVIMVQAEFTNFNGDTIPPLTYESDFIYYDNLTNQRIIEDVKGSEYFIDERFITIKQVLDKIGIEKKYYLRIILKRGNEWVEYKLGEKKKSQKLIKKQREALNSLKKEKHDKTLVENKIVRYKARYEQLKGKDKLTKKERERLIEITDFLKSKGIII